MSLKRGAFARCDFARVVLFFCLFLFMGAFNPAQGADAVKSRYVLTSADAEKYAEIFSLLDEGSVTEALKLNAGVGSPLLKGYVLAAAYMSSATPVPTKKEAENWLVTYKNLPVAPHFYEFLMKKNVSVGLKRPSDNAASLSAGACTSVHIPDPMDYVYFKKTPIVPVEHKSQVYKSLSFFANSLRRGKTLAGKLHLDDPKVKKYVPNKDLNESLTALSFAYFIDREDEKAWNTLRPVLDRVGDGAIPLASWTAGLIQWRMGHYPLAQRYFKAVADSEKTSAALRSQAAYWTTRAFIKNQDYTDVLPYLQIAAESSPHSFYGILAQRALGWDIGHNWKRPVVRNEADIKIVSQTEGGKRALAFLQIGRIDDAEKEIVLLYAERPELRPALVSFADSLPEAPELSARLSGLTGEIETVDGKRALYPFPSWIPLNGWQVDKALVYAFVRQESCFKDKAFSKAGARGVMQLMPGTAKLMAKKLGESYQMSKLHRIPYNLMVGQELVATLLNHPYIQGNLFMTVAAYNCGTRNIKSWGNRKDFQNDPLLFVEGIPSRETRGFVKKVMANYWIYRSLFGKSLESIDELLAGQYPHYHEN